MNATSVLIPQRIIDQSNAAITALESGNGNLERAKTAFGPVINNLTLRGASFDNVKQKCEDYLLIANALILANDADIADHRELIRLVGDQELVGTVIIPEQDRYRLARSTAEGRMAHYRGIKNSTDWWQRFHSNPLRERHNHAERQYGIHQGLYNNADAQVRYLQDKRDDFTRIQRATRDLFTDGTALRTTALSGLEYIELASSGLPDTYNAFGINLWRNGLLNDKDTLIDAMMERLVSHRDEHGNIVWDWAAIEAMLGRDSSDIGGLEFVALADAFASMDSLDDLERFLNLFAIPLTFPEDAYFDIFDLGSANRIDPLLYIICQERIGGVMQALGDRVDALRINIEGANIEQRDGLEDEWRRLMGHYGLLYATSIVTMPNEETRSRQLLIGGGESAGINMIRLEPDIRLDADGNKMNPYGTTIRFNSAVSFENVSERFDGVVRHDVHVGALEEINVHVSTVFETGSGGINVLRQTTAHYYAAHQFSWESTINKAILGSMTPKSLMTVLDVLSSIAAAESIQRDILSISANAITMRYIDTFQLETVIITGDLGVHAVLFSEQRSARRFEYLSNMLEVDIPGEFFVRYPMIGLYFYDNHLTDDQRIELNNLINPY